MTKGYLDVVATGMNILSAKPANPIAGDCYYDGNTGNSYVFNGTNWTVFNSTPSSPPRSNEPTAAELEKYPALKESWEAYLITKKLIGHHV